MVVEKFNIDNREV